MFAARQAVFEGAVVEGVVGAEYRKGHYTAKMRGEGAKSKVPPQAVIMS